MKPDSDILNAIKLDKNNIRISANGRWLYFDETNREWVIRTAFRGGSVAIFSCPESDEKAAIIALLAEG